MKARVHIFLKDSVFDPQGNTIAQMLRRTGFEKVHGVRMGKVIDVETTHQVAAEALSEVKKMCEKILTNPVIESYRVELMES